VTQSTLAAFDIACWDLIGQSLGVPIWKLIGGRFRDRPIISFDSPVYCAIYHFAQ